MYSAIGLGVVSFFMLAFLVSQVGHFNMYWTMRSKEWSQATLFLTSENCANPLVRSRLGTFNLCDTSEQILSRFPITSALYDVAQDLNICGHGRCSMFYVDVTANLHKVVIGSGVLAVIGLYIFRRCLADNRIDNQIHYYQLPSTHSRHIKHM